jgi:amino acid transporter
MVTRDNFGMRSAKVAGVSLLTDYILTVAVAVAVAVAAGTAALTSAVPGLSTWRVPISLGFVVLIAFGNLRGVRESGKVFAVPTYFVVANMAVLLGFGAFRMLSGGLERTSYSEHDLAELTRMGSAGQGFFIAASLFVVLHAFASGGAASRPAPWSPTCRPSTSTRCWPTGWRACRGCCATCGSRPRCPSACPWSTPTTPCSTRW